MEQMTIGQRIAVKRKELGISQITLGEMMGVSRQSISKWEADAAIPEIDKLIALSRLFKVSVGWLLGVEEEPRSDEPEEAVAEREQLLIEQLTQSRPAIPRWIKPAVVISLVLSLLGVGLGAAAWHRAESYEHEAASLSRALSQTIGNLPFASELIVSDVLDSYQFIIVPGGDMEAFEFQLSAFPNNYQETDRAELVIYLGGEEFSRHTCQWSGSAYRADFRLDTRNGYSAVFCLTSESGFVRSVPLSDGCLNGLLSATSFGDVRVDFEYKEYEDGVLTLSELYFFIDLPRVYRDLSDPWTRCDLVVLADGEEVGRLDMLNRSAYSRQINFMDPDFVEFTSQSQSIQVGKLTKGQQLELRLEGEFTTGLILRKTIQTWTHWD